MEVETDDLFSSEEPAPIMTAEPELDMDPDTLVLGETRSAPAAPAAAPEEPVALEAPREEARSIETRREPLSEPPILEVPPPPMVEAMAEEEETLPPSGQVFEMPVEPPPPPPLTAPPTPEDDEVLVRRDLDEDMDQFERSGKALSRPEVWEKYEADERSHVAAPAEEPELEALAARASLTELIPARNNAQAAAQGPLSDEDVDRIAKRVAEILGDRIIRDVAWDVVPEMAERLVRARIEELEKI